jgi:hypothetical protein
MRDNLSTLSFLQRNTDLLSNQARAVEEYNSSQPGSSLFDEQQINSTYDQIVTNVKSQLSKQLDNSI